MKTDLPSSVAPVLVLGIGNSLLADDGVGLELLELMRGDAGDEPVVEYVDGGTQGLMLLGLLEQRRALLILDAVQRGDAAGSVHHVREPQRIEQPRGFGVHGGNASELLATAQLLGGLPDRVHLVGVEPQDLCTRVGLSSAVRDALPRAAALARTILAEFTAAPVAEEGNRCTS